MNAAIATIVLLALLVVACVVQIRYLNRDMKTLFGKVRALERDTGAPPANEPPIDTATRLLRLEASDRSRALREALKE